MDDLISRQAVLNICDLRHRYDIPYEYDEGGKHIKGYDEGRIINVTKLKQLPSAEKTGYWNFIGDQMFECSECKHIFTQRQLESWRTYTYESEFPNYCPKCGAKMVEE